MKKSKAPKASKLQKDMAKLLLNEWTTAEHMKPFLKDVMNGKRMETADNLVLISMSGGRLK